MKIMLGKCEKDSERKRLSKKCFNEERKTGAASRAAPFCDTVGSCSSLKTAHGSRGLESQELSVGLTISSHRPLEIPKLPQCSAVTCAGGPESQDKQMQSPRTFAWFVR
eukprot:g77706.t1